MTPHQGIVFSFNPLSNSLVSVSDLCRDFWADTVPFKGPQLCLVYSFKKHKDTVSEMCRAEGRSLMKPSITTAGGFHRFVRRSLVLASLWPLLGLRWRTVC